MRKILSVLLAALLLFSCALAVSAEESSFVMTATKEVEISYILSIPQAVEIDPEEQVTYGEAGTLVIENIMQPIQVLEANGFTENNKQLNVTLNHPGVLTSADNNTIPYVIHLHNDNSEAMDIDYNNIPSGQTFKWYPDEELGKDPVIPDEFWSTKLIYEYNSNLYRVNHWGVYIDVEDWDAAPVGTYTATVSFTAAIADKT